MAEVSNTAGANMRFRREVHAKTRGRCFYCGAHVRCADEPLPRDWLLVRGGDYMVLDHAHPTARGGVDDLDNRLPACPGCNAAKGGLTVDEFRTLKGLRTGNPSFTFPGEDDQIPRDWLCVFSEAGLRDLFHHNRPYARAISTRRRTLRPGRRR